MNRDLKDFEFLRTACGLGILFLLLAWESSAPFLRLFEDRRQQRFIHGARNLLLGLLNSGVSAAAMVALWTVAARWSEEHRFGLLNWLDWPIWARGIVAITCFDLWMYWWHRANHRVGFLWRFHRTHHSDPKMDVTTAHRFHFGEIALSSLLRAPVIVLLGMHLLELVVYETIMFAIVQLHHANVVLPKAVDRLLRLILVTPTIHKVHHSRFQPETDSNYSSLFSWWDRIFRSFRLRADPASIAFGLDGYDAGPKQTLAGMLKTPLGCARPRAQQGGMKEGVE